MRRTVPWLLLILVVPLANADGPILHEYIPGAGNDELPIYRGQSDEPAGLVYDGEILPTPTGGPRRQDEQSMGATPGDGVGREEAGRRSPSFRPDRVTALEGTLGYYTVFNPTIAPFKRITALDAVVQMDQTTPVLGIADPSTNAIAVMGADAEDDRPRDRFWGNVVLDFRHGQRVPFPSVSPESRILTLRAQPEASIRIEKDQADNYFAVLETGPRTEVRVIFLTDAPQSYFGVERIPEVAANVLVDEVMPLQPRTQRDALMFARELGIGPDDTLPAVLEALTQHFRSFVESEQPPPITDSIYLDLARGMKGVCRHRAYGFTITAQALGVPTRFVQNEAHAWVEVKMVGVGWMRIDLGGAASALETHGGSNQPLYEPPHADPLPQPIPYREGYSQLEGDVRGLRNDTADSFASQPMPGPTPHEAQAPSRSAVERLLGEPAVSDVPAARPLRLLLDQPRHDVFRGRTLTITGRAENPDGEGAEGLRIEVLLRDRRERLLGVTATRAGGAFQASVGVPPDLPVGNYRLIVRTPGNQHYLPASAH